MSGFSDAGGGDVKGKASSFVGCNVVGVEVSLEVLLEGGVCCGNLNSAREAVMWPELLVRCGCCWSQSWHLQWVGVAMVNFLIHALALNRWVAMIG